MYWRSAEYKKLAETVIDEMSDLHWIRGRGFEIEYLESDREKRSNGRDIYAECIKVPELYNTLTGDDFLIVVYLPNVSHLTADQKKILMYHELLHIGADGNGSARINPHDVEDFRRIIDRYGIDWSK